MEPSGLRYIGLNKFVFARPRSPIINITVPPYGPPTHTQNHGTQISSHSPRCSLTHGGCAGSHLSRFPWPHRRRMEANRQSQRTGDCRNCEIRDFGIQQAEEDGLGFGVCGEGRIAGGSWYQLQARDLRQGRLRRRAQDLFRRRLLQAWAEVP